MTTPDPVPISTASGDGELRVEAAEAVLNRPCKNDFSLSEDRVSRSRYESSAGS